MSLPFKRVGFIRLIKINIKTQPIKVWSSDRTNRRCIIASNLNELKQKAAEKLSYSINLPSQLKLVLENDGTLIENDETLMKHASADSVFLLLRVNEKWIPPALGIFKNAMCSVPEVITDALKKLELIDKPPLSWRLMDNKGNITVVLHWDHRNRQQQQTRRAIATTTSNLFIERSSIERCGVNSSTNSSRPNSGIGQWTFDLFPNKLASNKKIQDSSNLLKSPSIYSKMNLNALPIGQQQLGTTPAISLPEMLNAFDDDEEDLSEEIINSTLIKELISPSQEFAKCDFHCASLHRTSLKPNIVRSAATSPIPEILRNTPPPIISVTNEDLNRPISPASSLIKKPKDIQKQHVRFVDDHKYEKDENNNRRLKQPSIQEADEDQSQADENDKNERNKELNKESNKDSSKRNEDDQEENLHERYLLLIDQLGEENGSHLSIKDIGNILDKMSSKIVDVDKLEKEKENDKAHNWLIKATVKGDFLREIGIIYNGIYYGIIEHPSYF